MVQIAMLRRAATFPPLCLAALLGCSAPSASSERSQDRITALARIGQNGAVTDVPSVLPSLSSDDPLVRWTAQRTLLQLAGTTNGYDWADTPANRDRAIQAWVAWCRDRGVAPSAKEASRG